MSQQFPRGIAPHASAGASTGQQRRGMEENGQMG